MNVDRISAVMHRHHHRHLERNQDRESKTEAANSQTTAAEETSTKQRGVLRLLEEGHFKGVAELRLNIRFHEELQNRQQTRTANVLEDSFSEIEKVVDEGLETLTAGFADNEATAEGLKKAGEDFITALQQTREQFLKGGAASPEDLSDTLAQQFAEFEAAVNSLLEPQETTPEASPAESMKEEPLQTAQTQETTTDPAAAANVGETQVSPETETVAGETRTVADPLAGLRQAFLDELEQMSQNLDSVTLPELSEPSGHGRAYDKFLAIYQQLHNPQGSAPDTTGTSAIDQSA